MMPSFCEVQGRRRFLEAYNTGPALVHVGTPRYLRELLRESRPDAAAVDTTNFESNYPTCAPPRFFKKPVCVFFALHAANDTPFSMPMRQNERHGFCTVLGDPVIVMLVYLARVGTGPGKRTRTHNPFKIK